MVQQPDVREAVRQHYADEAARFAARSAGVPARPVHKWAIGARRSPRGPQAVEARSRTRFASSTASRPGPPEVSGSGR